MAKVIISVDVEDAARWEAGFRSRADYFRQASVTNPIHFSVEGDHVVACFEPDDLSAFMANLKTQETADAMAKDGLKRDTLNISVLDSEFVV